MTGFSGVFDPELSTLSLQKFVNYDSGFSAPAVVPTEISAVDKL